jgi:SlyX protein
MLDFVRWHRHSTTMNTNELKKRVVELETRTAFQEQTISDLSDVIVRQQADIDRVHQMMQRLVGRMESIEELGGQGSELEPPPPHY